MTDATMEEAAADEDAPKKTSKLPLILGLVLALAGGGGGFFVVSSGLIGGGAQATEDHADNAEEAAPDPLEPASFLALDPLTVALPGPGRQHLRFSAQLDVDPAHLEEVQSIQPRIVDVLNGYLRAVELRDLEDPAALMRLRAQMLRRVQVVTGEGRVRDLLVMEFVVS